MDKERKRASLFLDQWWWWSRYIFFSSSGPKDTTTQNVKKKKFFFTEKNRVIILIKHTHTQHANYNYGGKKKSHDGKTGTEENFFFILPGSYCRRPAEWSAMNDHHKYGNHELIVNQIIVVVVVNDFYWLQIENFFFLFFCCWKKVWKIIIHTPSEWVNDRIDWLLLLFYSMKNQREKKIGKFIDW